MRNSSTVATRNHKGQSSCSSHNGDLVGETNSSFAPPALSSPPLLLLLTSPHLHLKHSLIILSQSKSHVSPVAGHEEEEGAGWVAGVLVHDVPEALDHEPEEEEQVAGPPHSPWQPPLFPGR